MAYIWSDLGLFFILTAFGIGKYGTLISLKNKT